MEKMAENLNKINPIFKVENNRETTLGSSNLPKLEDAYRLINRTSFQKNFKVLIDHYKVGDSESSISEKAS